jgi:hypothetical protein
MVLIIKILIFLFRRNYRLTQLYIKIQDIGHPEIHRYFKA